MEIYLAENAGFCFGVERALRIAYETIKKAKTPIYTLGQLIHNPQVVDELQNKGIKPVENLTGISEGTLIIRSHGLPLYVIEEAKRRNFSIVDATCPFVRQAQEKTRLLSKEGYQVLVLGEREHAEVEGILGFAGKDTICITNHNYIKNLVLSNKVGVVAQTTQSIRTLSRVVAELVKIGREVRVFNTICTSTQMRQASALRLAKEVDCMLVVGGRNSANTKRLATLVADSGIPAYHIEKKSELDENLFSGLTKIGVTGGASTPDWVIRETIDELRRMTNAVLVT